MKKVQCKDCEGDGENPCPVPPVGNIIWIECEECNGTGKVWEEDDEDERQDRIVHRDAP